MKNDVFNANYKNAVIYDEIAEELRTRIGSKEITLGKYFNDWILTVEGDGYCKEFFEPEFTSFAISNGEKLVFLGDIFEDLKPRYEHVFGTGE